MSNGKDTNSIYDYSMIFNNINKVNELNEVKDDNNVNGDKDNKLYNTNLISDLDLQNFDPKRYEYYTNLVYIYNKDPKTLYDLLNKYYSIKNIKDKEKKLIRIISNYARLHRDMVKDGKKVTETSKDESKLLESIVAVLEELTIKVDDYSKISTNEKVCFLIMQIIKKISEEFEKDKKVVAEHETLIDSLIELFKKHTIIASYVYNDNLVTHPTTLTDPLDIYKNKITNLQANIEGILKDIGKYPITLVEEVFAKIEDCYLNIAAKAVNDASASIPAKTSLSEYLEEINKYNSPTTLIIIDNIWQLFINFRIEYNENEKISGGALPEDLTKDPAKEPAKEPVKEPANELDKLIEKIESLIDDKIEDTNDEIPISKNPPVKLKASALSGSPPVIPPPPSIEELEKLRERIEKLEFAIQNTPGTGNLLLGNNIAKNGILLPLLKSAIDKPTYKKAVQPKDDGSAALRKEILDLIPNVDQNLKNKINDILKVKGTWKVWQSINYTIDIKKKTELKEFYNSISFPIKDELKLICKKLAQLYTDDLRKELIKHTVFKLHTEYKKIDKLVVINPIHCTKMTDKVGSIVKMIDNIDIRADSYKILNNSTKIDDKNTKVFFDNKYKFVISNTNLKLDSHNNVDGIRSCFIPDSKNWEGVVQEIQKEFYVVKFINKFINTDEIVLLVHNKNCNIVGQSNYEQYFADDSKHFNNLNKIEDIETIINKIKEFSKKLLLDLDILQMKIEHIKKCYEGKLSTPINKNMVSNYVSYAKECNDLIEKIKNPKYIYDIIDSLFPDKRKKYVIEKIITHLQSIYRINADDSKSKFITSIKQFIDILKFVPTEKPAIFGIIQRLEKHRNDNMQDKSYNYYINIIINKLTTLFTVNDDVDKEHHYPESFLNKIVQLYGTTTDFGTVDEIYYEKDENNRISMEIVTFNIKLITTPTTLVIKNLLDIIIKPQQSGGAYIEDDVLKARYLMKDNDDDDDTILGQLNDIKEGNRNGKKKTNNKIEELSNDIDYYNRLENKDSNATKKIIQQINNFENDPNNPIEELALTFDDRLVFIIATFFIRYITLMLVQWSIDINIIKTFYEGFIYYAIIYIIIFWFIVLFINVDNSYDVNYMNFNGIINSIRTLFYYFYMGTNGISRLLIHTSLIIILIIVPIILNIKNKVEFVDEEDNENAKILNNDERKQLSKSLSLFTMFIWLFTSIIATKF